mgnify:CR=1 FL=1
MKENEDLKGENNYLKQSVNEIQIMSKQID